jgi:hypothetical protein
MVLHSAAAAGTRAAAGQIRPGSCLSGSSCSPTSHRKYEDIFGAKRPLCRCAAAALRACLGLQGNQAIVGPLEWEEDPIWFWYQQLDEFSAVLVSC